MNKNSLTRILLVALFAALISVGAYLKIMIIPPVPITLQTLFVIILSLVLPLKLSLSSVLVYLLLGASGLPVFTSGGGLAALLGPTGGYLLGTIPAVITGSLLTKLNGKNNLAVFIITATISTLFIYLAGLPWLGLSRGFDLGKTLTYGLYPFIIGDILKIIVAAITAKAIKGRIDLLLERKED